MYYVTVPESVQIINKVTGNEVKTRIDDEVDVVMDAFTIFRYIVMFITPDPAWGKGRKADRARNKIEDAFEDAEPGSVVAIEDEWRDLAMKVIDKPEGPQPGAWMSQLTGFHDAFADATTEAPGAEE